jgi:hypothetical protein
MHRPSSRQLSVTAGSNCDGPRCSRSGATNSSNTLRTGLTERPTTTGHALIHSPRLHWGGTHERRRGRRIVSTAVSTQRNSTTHTRHEQTPENVRTIHNTHDDRLLSCTDWRFFVGSFFVREFRCQEANQLAMLRSECAHDIALSLCMRMTLVGARIDQFHSRSRPESRQKTAFRACENRDEQVQWYRRAVSDANGLMARASGVEEKEKESAEVEWLSE